VGVIETIHQSISPPLRVLFFCLHICPGIDKCKDQCKAGQLQWIAGRQKGGRAQYALVTFRSGAGDRERGDLGTLVGDTRQWAVKMGSSKRLFVPRLSEYCGVSAPGPCCLRSTISAAAIKSSIISSAKSVSNRDFSFAEKEHTMLGNFLF